MKINITQLFLLFDELTPATNEEQGVYWFRMNRTDGLIITLAFSIYESYVDIIIRNDAAIDIVGLSLNNCSEVRVLDEERKCLEVIHDNGKGRCFLSLLGTVLLEYDEG